MGFAIEKSAKRKVIELYQNGCTSPNLISSTLNKQGIRISYGSTWNVIQDYKRNNNGESGSPTTIASAATPVKTPSRSAADLQQHRNQVSLEADLQHPTKSVTDLKETLQQQQQQQQQHQQEDNNTYTDNNVNIDAHGSPLSNTAAASPPHTNAASPPKYGSGLTKSDSDLNLNSTSKNKNPGQPFSFLSKVVSSTADDTVSPSVIIKTLPEVVFDSSEVVTAPDGPLTLTLAPAIPIDSARAIPGDGTSAVGGAGANIGAGATGTAVGVGAIPGDGVSVVGTTGVVLGGGAVVGGCGAIGDVVGEQLNIAGTITSKSVNQKDGSSPKDKEGSDQQHHKSGYFPSLSAPKATPGNTQDYEPETEASTPVDYWVEDFEAAPATVAAANDISVSNTTDKEESVISEQMDWDADWASRLWRRIQDAKVKQREERLSLDRERESIALEKSSMQVVKQNLDLVHQNLVVREYEVGQYKDIILICKELQQMGMELDSLRIVADVVREKAVREGTDMKIAAALIVSELQSYQERGGIDLVLKQAQSQFTQTQMELASLNVKIKENRQAIESLKQLKNNNVSDSDLIELNALVHSWSVDGISQEEKQKNGNGSTSKMLKLDTDLHLPQGKGKKYINN
jgi:hypothetical protein